MTDKKKIRKKTCVMNGHKLTLLPVSPFLVDKAMATVNVAGPEPPTYTAVTAAGVEEVHPHDETTLETDEDRRAWAEYLEQKRAAEQARQESLIRILFVKGIEVNIPKNGWVEEQQFFGIDVPKNPLELKVHFISTEVLHSLDDMLALMGDIMELSGVSREAIEVASESFLGEMEGHTAQQAENQSG